MHVIAYQSIDALAIWAQQWRGLARGVPFRQWEWFRNWWQVYGEDTTSHASSRTLYTVCIHDDTGNLIAVAPWYIDHSISQGRVIRFVGSGEVCSDYLSILCHPGREQEVAKVLADFISHDRTSLDEWLDGTEMPRWDLLHLEGVDAKDETISLFLDEMQKHGKTVDRSFAHNCWRLTLPKTWENVVAQASKSQRKNLRRVNRRLEDIDRFRVCEVESAEDFDRGFDVLTALHQARWLHRGLSGCFSSDAFRAFHYRVAADLLRQGNLRLYWIEHEGQPIAAEYQMLGNGVVYLYQCGLDPNFLSLEPGRMAVVAGIRWAIDHGYEAVDFLRGDEPYKASWGARPRAAVQVRIVADHPTAQLRHRAWVTQKRIKGMVKSGLNYFKAVP